MDTELRIDKKPVRDDGKLKEAEGVGIRVMDSVGRDGNSPKPF
jgi:hypothetical protein